MRLSAACIPAVIIAAPTRTEKRLLSARAA
jgi:hypothetical protein